jgi:excinuclease ABC subunit C
VSVRDEAHRFCLKQHRSRRQKAAVHSLLDEVPGVGPVRRKRLMKRFGSLEKMRQAGAEEIAATPGVSLQLAQRIYAALLEDAFVDIAVEEARLRKRMRLRPVPPPEE